MLHKSKAAKELSALCWEHTIWVFIISQLPAVNSLDVMTMVVVLENLNFSALCFVSDILDGFWEDIRFFFILSGRRFSSSNEFTQGTWKITHIHTKNINVLFNCRTQKSQVLVSNLIYLWKTATAHRSSLGLHPLSVFSTGILCKLW